MIVYVSPFSSVTAIVYALSYSIISVIYRMRLHPTLYSHWAAPVAADSFPLNVWMKSSAFALTTSESSRAVVASWVVLQMPLSSFAGGLLVQAVRMESVTHIANIHIVIVFSMSGFML